jgi:8-amino-7-oxononanoate synthase
MEIYNTYTQALDSLKENNNFRTIPDIELDGYYVKVGNGKLVNLSGNDYLGIGSDSEMRYLFLENVVEGYGIPLGATSSRLLTGNSSSYKELEDELATLYNKEACLIMNSGYHANIGILPALTDKYSLILADKYVHASIIDGIKLSDSENKRFKHNDMNHLELLLKKYAGDYSKVFIVTESIFSMDGDIAPIEELIALKKQYPNVLIYIDEAHAVGIRGKKGLGICEEKNCLEDIDILVGTFGKAFASMGAFVICNQIIKDYLINKARPFIFSTALPALNIAWSNFVLYQITECSQQKREYLKQIRTLINNTLIENNYNTIIADTPIIPIITGDNESAIALAKQLKTEGFYASAIRPPTVAQGTSRVRISLSAAIPIKDIEKLINTLHNILK